LAAVGNYSIVMAFWNSKPAPGGSANAAIDWSAVWAEHGRWLRTVVLARLGEPAAVDEVMQDVALAAVAQRAPIADCHKLPAWLYRLAVRQALMFRRRAGRQRRMVQRYADDVLPESVADGIRDPLAWLLVEEQRRLVRVALKRLPARDAEILLLKYTEDWSYRELARRLDISTGAVEARLHRAKMRLRAELAALDMLEVPS
jgi:RNA polymerase sigma factor (sigma-70 family)